MSTISTYAATLRIIATNVPMVINFSTVIIGTIGGICNLITFTAVRLRQNSCVFYLLCANIFQILSVLFVIPTRIASDNFQGNLERQSIVFCKLRYYLSIVFPKLVSYYMLLAIADRCLATSNRAETRAWSRVKVAHRASFILLILAFATATHTIVFYDIFNKTCQVPPGSVYTIVFAVYLLVIVSLLPHALMLIFSLITVSNLRKTRRRILPAVVNTYSLQKKRLESQLIKMIVVQVVISSALISLRSGSYLYSTMTSGNPNKTIDAYATETFLVRFGIGLYYFTFAISFYISTLTSKIFREIFKKRLQRFYQRLRD